MWLPLANRIQFRGVAQLVAHLVWDQGVAGSNPVTPTTEKAWVYSPAVLSLGESVDNGALPEYFKTVLRGVAQLVAHLVWDQGVAGSNPVTPTRMTLSRNFFERVVFFSFFRPVGV